jgi:hypothetical protein
MATDYVVIAASLVLSTCCWWFILRSGDGPLLKSFFAFIAAVPFLGPFVYLVTHGHKSPRPVQEVKHQVPEKQSAFLRHWNEREHIYLGWASFVFWTLAIVAYWVNGWRPGAIRAAMFNLGFYTDVDVIFFSLLVGAVLTFGVALRAKVVFVRKLREASNFLLQQTGQTRPAAE